MQTPHSDGSLLRAENITKTFPGVVAVRNVTFALRPGEIHALCGENGAGKSTLIKILSGIHPYGSYEGKLYADGQPARFQSVADAEAAGIAAICQELALVPEMSVAENLFLGSEPRRHGLIDWDAVYRDARELLARFRLDIDPSVKTANLGTGHKQLLEILKALRKKSRVLILDEPTAALTENEVGRLFSVMAGLKQRGFACAYISHRLDEVFAVSDQITVLRDGASVATFRTSETNKSEIIRHMVGREIRDLFPRRASKTGGVLFEARNLTIARPEDEKPFLQGIGFDVRAGEVVGIGGLMGSGRTELLMHLFGAWGQRVAGTVTLRGKAVKATPHESIQNGMVLVTEDRRRYGLIMGRNVGFNMSLSSLRTFSLNGLIDSLREFRANRGQFESLRVKASGLEANVDGLSGGNQQKVVIAKALMTEPQIIFMDEPTRGIDIGAKLEVYEIINRLTEEGKAVVLVSSELPELMGMSDRILMLHEGTIGGAFSRREATQEVLMAAALGHRAAMN